MAAVLGSGRVLSSERGGNEVSRGAGMLSTSSEGGHGGDSAVDFVAISCVHSK